MSVMTPEMRQWLSDNREDYEFYLLHALLHDPLWRTKMISTPVVPNDFWREEYALVMGAVIGAVKVLGVLNHSLPCPPTREFLRTYIEVTARQEGSEDEEVAGALRLVTELQDPKFKEMHYTIPAYFEAWYGSRRAKLAARELNKFEVPDVHGQIASMQQALASASQAATTAEDDMMDDFLDGDSLERVERRPTGIAGLDDCLNGGAGLGECYLLFSGTGGGKSIAAGQISWNEAANNDGWPLVVTTELLPREYASRTVSNAAGVPIPVVQDCENIAQVRQAVAAETGVMYKLPKVDEVLAKIRERIRYHKVSPDDGMESRMLLEREVLAYEAKMGKMPTMVILDWLGSVADLGGGKGSTSERAMAWEIAANGCVKFAESSGIPTFVLAQAVNDAQLKSVLTLNDIGISKGIAKQMVAAIGITNAIKTKEITAATQGKQDMPRSMVHEDQLFCVAKARKGEGRNVQVRRDFRFQRFVVKPRE